MSDDEKSLKAANEQLMPCPFCGGEAEFVRERDVWHDYVYIYCIDCGFTTGQEEPINADNLCKQWNRRVPQEMSARDFVKHYSRMCHTINRCTQCLIFAEATKENPIKSCWFWVRDNTEKAVSIVEQWAKDNPENKRKTYAEDFKEHFGHLWNNKNNNWQCRGMLYNDATDCVNSPRYDCEACWNEEMRKEEGD